VVFRLSADWVMILEDRKLKRDKLYPVMVYVKERLKHVSRNCGETYILQEAVVLDPLCIVGV
jgi:hypothetical protein